MNDNFEEYLRSKGKSISTVKHYQTYAMAFLRFLEKDGVSPEGATSQDVMSFMAHLQEKGLSNATRSLRLGVIKQYFYWMILRGFRVNNPAEHIKLRGVKHRKLHTILEYPQLEYLYIRYPEPKEDDPMSGRNWFPYYLLSKRRNKVIISILINQGVTTAEVEQLTLSDLKLREGKIRIPGGRKSNERTLDLKPNQIMPLMEYLYQTRGKLLEYQQEPTDRLFLPTPVVGQRIASGGLQVFKGLTKELRQLEPQFENFKQVRASVITHWIKHNNLREVQYMAGHRYISSTESYLAHQIEDLKEEIDRFHPF